jgi:hypothetical protein
LRVAHQSTQWPEHLSATTGKITRNLSKFQFQNSSASNCCGATDRNRRNITNFGEREQNFHFITAICTFAVSAFLLTFNLIVHVVVLIIITTVDGTHSNLTKMMTM